MYSKAVRKKCNERLHVHDHVHYTVDLRSHALESYFKTNYGMEYALRSFNSFMSSIWLRNINI